MTLRRIGTWAAAATLVLLGAACAPWPAERGGGGAELSWAGTASADAEAQDLDRRLQTCRESLDALRAAGGDRKAPAALATAEELLIRSDREVAGGLYVDATLGIERAASTLAEVSSLVELPMSTGCLA